ncbi:MAG: hypothetical protein AAF772_07395 [Acidobacteriota bacterium]
MTSTTSSLAATRRGPIDEVLISGYLDGALTHAEAQRVRIVLEDDADARALYHDLRRMREAARHTDIAVLPDEAWPELPTTRGSRWLRSLGFVLMVVWVVVISALALWQFLSQAGDPIEIFLVLGLPGAFVLLFLSVLIDRIKALKTDRYRGVTR